MGPSLARRVILIVEDTESIAELLREVLAEEPTYQPVIVGDAVRALEIVASVKVDLILLDVMLPGMNGIELCERIRANERTKHVPMLFLTADTTAIRELDSRGIHDHLLKPFDLEELTQWIVRLLERDAE